MIFLPDKESDPPLLRNAMAMANDKYEKGD